MAHKGSNSANYKPKEYYATKTTKRTDFKKICKNQGWLFDDFEETFGEWHYYNNGARTKYYYYKVKEVIK